MFSELTCDNSRKVIKPIMGTCNPMSSPIAARWTGCSRLATGLVFAKTTWEIFEQKNKPEKTDRGGGRETYRTKESMEKQPSQQGREALMKLMELDYHRRTCTQDEFNRLTSERQDALIMLMRSSDPLLNMVAVAATRNRGAWMVNEHDLMHEIQEWLGQRAELQDA
jgi:hypothetical protein